MRIGLAYFFFAITAGIAAAQTPAATPGATIPSPQINTTFVADNFPGADIGAQINHAVAACRSAGFLFCSILVSKSGIISTPPELPIGFSLFFNPTGVYTLSTHWVIDHRATSFFFNGATFSYTLHDGGSAFYVGKNLSALAAITNAGSSTCPLSPGQTATGYVSRLRGSDFGAMDTGDQLSFFSGGALHTFNVASATSKTICLTESVAPPKGSVTVVGGIAVGTALGLNGGSQPNIHDLIVYDSGTAADTALTLELTENVRIDHFVAADFTHGTCMQLLGAITTNATAVSCFVDGNGIRLAPNSIGGFLVSTSNANRFFGLDLQGSTIPSGFAIYSDSGGGNDFLGLHIEGEQNDQTIEDGGQNYYGFTDYERNGTAAATHEILLNGSGSVLAGPSQMQSYRCGTLVEAAAGSTGTLLENLQFSVPAHARPACKSYAYRFLPGATGKASNIGVSAGDLFVDPGMAVAGGGNPSAVNQPPPGSNIVYRCTESGVLPTGALTTNRSNCGSSIDTGLRAK